MVIRNSRACGWLLLCALATGTGCTALRELPRSEYAARPERQHVKVETTEGLHYEFDYVQVANDSLTGFKERDTEGPVSEVSTLRMPLEEVRALSTRQVDWYKTGLAGGGAVAALVAAVVTTVHKSGTTDSGTSGGGKGGVPGGN